VSTPPITILRPVCGLDQYDEETLRSSFLLDYRPYEVVFCAARASDAAVPLIKKLITEHPDVDAYLLIGDQSPSSNPKLNNLVKGWQAAKHDWIVMADSNVLLPRDYITRLLSRWSAKTGLVCSPPLGSRPQNFWSEVECAFLNTYQLRWQYAADSIGFGFAQGKSMLWHRPLLDEAGGILALARDAAEDAAATKIVRDRGLRVRLADGAFEQPLGSKTLKAVWDRQLRWARLRRATFQIYFLPELLTGSLPALASGAIAADQLGGDIATCLVSISVFWYGLEVLLARTCRWPLTATTPLAFMMRDVALPVLWCAAWTGDNFNWRGNEMTVAVSSAPVLFPLPGD
jgi:ceramide glucosyltransferase